MMYLLKYDAEFHFMATFETAFKLPLFCRFTLVSFPCGKKFCLFLFRILRPLQIFYKT